MLAERLTQGENKENSALRSLAELLRRHRAIVIPLSVALSSRIVTFIVADLIMRFALTQRKATLPFNGPIAVWQRKDALWYIVIAQYGYNYSPTSQSRANFFPLFPLLLHIFAPLFSIFSQSNPYALAGMALSWVLFALACVGLYRLTCDHFGPKVALMAVALLAFFPFSLYYGAVYTESIYLALAIWAFIAVERCQWWTAAALAGIASASRPPGLLIGACVGLAYLIDWYRFRRPLRLNILALALTPLGTLSYMLYCWARWGDPLAYAKTSAAGWDGHLQLNGIRYIAHVIRHPITWIGTRDANHELDFIAITLMVCFVALCLVVWRLLGPVFAMFAVASILAPLLDFSNANSLGRYLSVVFPVFMVLAYLLRGHPRVAVTLCVVGQIVLILFASYFIAGYGLS